MQYLRRTLNYLERASISDMVHMMSMVDPIATRVKILRIDSGCSLQIGFTELIRMNP